MYGVKGSDLFMIAHTSVDAIIHSAFILFYYFPLSDILSAGVN